MRCSTQDRYVLEEVIGNGGMGAVHRAQDTKTGQLVAVKIPHPCCDQCEVGVRFRLEQHILSGLNHPAIVRMLDCGNDFQLDGSDNPCPYIVTELVDGITIRELVVLEAPLAASAGCAVIADVLSGLDYAHRHQIVHGDISPGNVMISTEGRAKIMDFGGSLDFGDADQTAPATVVRTPRYMAPEQALGQPLDPQTDVYGCGCLLYTLLTGQPPFPGDDPVALAFQHTYQPVAPPSARRPTIPTQLDATVIRALAKHRRDRYPDANTFRRDLLDASRKLP